MRDSKLPATSYQLPATSFAFTLIELLVVVTIIVILTAIGAVSYQAAGRKARNGKRQADLEQIRAALEMYRADVGSYPATVTFDGASSITFGSNTYMARVPCDPKCQGASCACVSYNNYTYSYSAPNYTLQARLEGSPLPPSTCTPAIPRNYCVNNP